MQKQVNKCSDQTINLLRARAGEEKRSTFGVMGDCITGKGLRILTEGHPSLWTVLSETLLCGDFFQGESDVMDQICQKKLKGWMKSASESTCCWHHLPIVVTQGQLSTTKHSPAQGQQPGESSCVSASVIGLEAFYSTSTEKSL